ncbi:MAG: aminodeoxychorismate synthase component I [Chromatiales bacterium]|nr:aminodeoxychorismate synthase component I [Chromatiales bacterium]MDX9767760.1 aminodeoxychorismate synthase component I [Ectothiorhodospiraceae bacterium]
MPRLLDELPWPTDPLALFESLADRRFAVLLDSGRIPGERSAADGAGRYDILAAEPGVTLVTRDGVTEVRDCHGTRLSPEDPFVLLRAALGDRMPSIGGLPFAGGAMGYFSYDLGRRIERLPALASDLDGLPEMAVGIYDWAVVLDHHERRAWLAGAGRDPDTHRRWPALRAQLSTPCTRQPRPRLRVTAALSSSLDHAAYRAAFARVQDYIRAGDCYQVNLAQRFAAPAAGDPWEGYRRLRGFNPAPFGAWLNLPWARILSSSPERFLRVRDGQVETRPIKGTRPRAGDAVRDRQLAAELAASPKDRAENLMIVDLLRNDLGKNCRPGSVRVPELFAVESYATVHHLVSTVTGELAPGRDVLDLLRGCFPGGSITGAPKLRAQQIIEELEGARRGVYCGAIGYIGFDGAMDTSIAIRTLVHADDAVHFWSGGGLVADSDAEAEYQETLDKAAAFLQLLSVKEDDEASARP